MSSLSDLSQSGHFSKFNSSKRAKVRRSIAALIAAVGLIHCAPTNVWGVPTDSTWTSTTDQLWNNAANWTPATVPNGDFNVTIGAVGAISPVQLNIIASIDTLTINPSFELDMLGGNSLTLTGATLVDNGKIVVNSNNSFVGTPLVLSNVTISGSGLIQLNDDAATTTAALNGSITQGASHSIVGQGQINAALTNNGTVNANVAAHGLTLATNNMTNNSLFEATTGALAINGIILTQGASGQIAAAGGNVTLTTTTVSGGVLNSSGGGVITSVGTNTLDSLTNNAAYNVKGGSTTNITGDLADSGTITVNNDQNFVGTTLSFGGGTLSGTGKIVLNDDTAVTTAALNGTLTQGAAHSIVGQGQINAVFTNNGTVNANVAAHGITLTTNTQTNNGLYQASNGGTLVVTTGLLTNLSGTTLTGGTYEVDNGSTINLPGTVNTNAASIILDGASQNFVAIAPVNSTSGSFTVRNGATFTTAGALTNSGTVDALVASTLNVSGDYTQTAGTTQVDGFLSVSTHLLNLNGGTLKGTGTITAASVHNNGGTIAPGDSPGLLTIDGDYIQNSGSLEIELAGNAITNNYDVLQVNGNANLGGELDVSLINGFVPQGVQDFTIVLASALVGQFTVTNLPDNMTVHYTSNSVFLHSVPEPASFGMFMIAAAMLSRRRAS